MTLESLSNEILLDLFEFIDVFNLLRAFSDLNIRFNSLLYVHFRVYRVDLRSVSKEDFTRFYTKYLPSIINHIVYLRLSDDDDTPYQCDHFQSNGLPIGRFYNLRALTFNRISSDVNINQYFFSDIYRLTYLTHLKFVNCQLKHIHIEDFQRVIDQIWNLPKLTHLYWDFSFKAKHYFSIPACISTSLQYLTIHNNDLFSNQFPSLFQKTPCLRKFSMSSYRNENEDLSISRQLKSTSQNLSITNLVLFSICSLDFMINLFQLLPNVVYLKVEIFSFKINGHRWEEIIVNYLPKLKHFQFKIDSNFSISINDETDEQKIDQYVATYRTSFWIEHHRWFIRCHWSRCNEYVRICIYSLPYTFDYFPLFDNNFNYKSISTCSSDTYFSYNSVRTIGYESWLFNDDVLSRIQLINIENLSIQLSTDHRFLSIIPNFDNLLSLTVAVPTEHVRLQLQIVLDRAPRLFSLSFKCCITSAMPPYQYISSSVRRLDLHGYDLSQRRYRYDSKQCMDLCQSSLGIQCRVLIMEVEKPKCILQLIYSMMNLRTLHVFCENDKRTNQYDLVKVLQHYLPSTWTITRLSYGRIVVQS